MHDKHIRILAVVATIAAICMYTSYIFQIAGKPRRKQSQPHPAALRRNQLYALGHVRAIQDATRLACRHC